MSDPFVYDCFGCLRAGLESGEIDEATYQEVLAEWEQLDKQATAPCPKCRAKAYISEYEPDLMHCPSCGLYSMRAGDDAQWQPFRQGIAR